MLRPSSVLQLFVIPEVIALTMLIEILHFLAGRVLMLMHGA